jgi:hypothetical protein
MAMPVPVENRIFARQIGRLAFGGVLLAGMTWLVASLVVSSFDDPGPVRLPGPAALAHFSAGQVVVGTWLAALAAGTAARWIAMRRGGPPGSDTRFAASLIVPSVGIALLLPITLHLAVVPWLTRYDFDLWALASLWLTWHAHLVFAGLAALRARRLAAGQPALALRAIYAATVLASCLPVVFATPSRIDFVSVMMHWVSHAQLAVVPPLIVAVTALPCLLVLRAMRRQADRERTEIATAWKLPRAVAVPPRRGA